MKKTSQIALGGVMAGLSVVVMLLTGLIPMAEFALPAIAGLFLIPIVVELGQGAGWLCYAAVALLSAIVASNKECALYYALFFGCYPLLKSLVERQRSRWREWVLKLVLFNLLAAGAAALAAFVFRFPGYDEMLQGAKWVLGAGWLFLNGVFVVYDIALTRLISGYFQWFRPNYIKKIFR